MEIPLLPVDLLPRHAKTRAQRLLHADRRGHFAQRPHRRLIEISRSPRHRHHSRVDHPQHFFLVGVPHHHHSLDRSAIDLPNVVAIHASNPQQPPPLFFRRPKVARRIAETDHRRKIRDPAPLHGRLPLRNFFHRVADTDLFLFGYVRLHSRNFFPRSHFLSRNIHNRLKRLRTLFDHYKRFAAQRLPRLPPQHFVLRRLAKREERKPGACIHMP